jgi:CheY-like chemotaxis protein
VSRGAAARILVVDDTDYTRDVLARLLERDGHRVATASGGAEALQRLQAEVFDLVLLDVMMPGVDGTQVLEALHGDDRLRHLPVSMLSALHDQERIVQCIQMGAQDYLPKPVNQQLLRARIASSLERKRLRDLERDYLSRVESISTQLQATNEQLRRADQLKSRVLATVAHDLKNPLGGILLLADRIHQESGEAGVPGSIGRQAARIREGVQRMLQSLNGLLDTAVQELGAVALHLEEVNLGDLVHEVVQANEPYAASKEIRIH